MTIRTQGESEIVQGEASEHSQHRRTPKVRTQNGGALTQTREANVISLFKRAHFPVSGATVPLFFVLGEDLGVAAAVVKAEVDAVARFEGLGGPDGGPVGGGIRVAAVERVLGVSGLEAAVEALEARSGRFREAFAASLQSGGEGVEVLSVLLQSAERGVEGAGGHEGVHALASVLEPPIHAVAEPGVEVSDAGGHVAPIGHDDLRGH